VSDDAVPGPSQWPTTPAAGRVVWHRKFGFGLAAVASDGPNSESQAQLTVDFGPHWGRRSIASSDALVRSAPDAEDADALAHPIDVPAGFSPVPDPVVEAFAAFSAGEPPPSADELDEAVALWNQSVRWIGKGWQDSDEHEHDLLYRESLEQTMAHAAMAQRLDAATLSAVLALDYQYWQGTLATSLCVWHTGTLYQCSGTTVNLVLRWYPRDRFWYYYRWPPEMAGRYVGHNVFTWQRDRWGLDFLELDYPQLRDRVLELSAEMWRAVNRRSAQGGAGQVEEAGGPAVDWRGFTADQRVLSRKFGCGKVLDVRRVDEQDIVRIDFGPYGVQIFDIELARFDEPGAALALGSHPAWLQHVAVGQRVEHWKFGRGQVLEVGEVDGYELARVKFELGGVRKLVVCVARLIEVEDPKR